MSFLFLFFSSSLFLWRFSVRVSVGLVMHRSHYVRIATIEQHTKPTKNLCMFFCVIFQYEVVPLKSVSSIVGAPCNVESSCNRAGRLGLGYADYGLASHKFLPQSGSRIRISSVSPRRWYIGSSLPWDYCCCCLKSFFCECLTFCSCCWPTNCFEPPWLYRSESSKMGQHDQIT